jgi:N-glycosylase/DNA lyase
MNPSAWSAPQPLPQASSLTAAVLAETLDGGQAFRWNRLADDTWLGVFGEHIVCLSLDPSGTLHWSTPTPTHAKSSSATLAKTHRALVRYLDLDRDPRALADALPWRSDPHLACCLAAFPGLRILRQPFGETLLGFLCSATKQIVQIKQMLALLAERHGAPLLPPETPNPKLGTAALQRRLPTWPQLATIAETDLRACLLGFRARYIHQTAQFLAAHPGWLDETETLPYAAAKERLCSLPGVGEKVADCVLLFGAGRLEAFPVDVWIIKAMAQRYGLDGWKPAQIAHFGRVHFGPLAGLAQQYLFAYERQARRTRAP